MTWPGLKERLALCVEGFGALTRFFFFALTLGMIMAAAWAAQQSSIGAVPFSELTLDLVMGAVVRGGLLLGACVVWFLWAFADGPKNYRRWASVGVVAWPLALFLAAGLAGG